MILSNHLILCCALLLLPQSFSTSESFPVRRLFTLGANVIELQLQRQSFQCIFRLTFFRVGWFDLLAVQGTLKCLLQHHSSKASILWCSAFFMVQLTSIYDCWKNQSFDYLDIFGKVRSLLFNTLSIFIIAFLPRTKHLLIFWLRSIYAMILEPKKIKSVSTFSHLFAMN